MMFATPKEDLNENFHGGVPYKVASCDRSTCTLTTKYMDHSLYVTVPVSDLEFPKPYEERVVYETLYYVDSSKNKVYLHVFYAIGANGARIVCRQTKKLEDAIAFYKAVGKIGDDKKITKKEYDKIML